MRNPILSIILIIVFTFTLIGCNQQPPPATDTTVIPTEQISPVTDSTSLIEDLRKMGTVVQLDGELINCMTSASSYVKLYRDSYDSIQHSIKIEPVFLEQESARLQKIEDSVKGYTVNRINLKVNGEPVSIYEYNSEVAANLDVEYINRLTPASVTAPSEQGEILGIYNCWLFIGIAHYYKKANIITLYCEAPALNNWLGKNSSSISDIFTKLLGPEIK
jgi:hypothetical protein